jgi:phenylacetate-CoA ligase
MVRYRTDDLVTVDRSPCDCGRTQLRFHIHGRKGDQIIVQGRSILPRDIREHVEDRHETAAGLFQIIKSQAQMDELAVRVGYSPAKLRGSTTDLAGSLAEELRRVLGVPVRVELTPDDELLKLGPPHKIPRVTKQ